MPRTVKYAVFSLLIVLAGTRNAYAYLDPGTGSMLLQGAIAAVAGGLVAGRIYWAKIKRLFSRGPAKSDGGEADRT